MCDSSTSEFLGEASVNNPEAFLLECLSSGSFHLDFTPDEVNTLCEAECCAPTSPVSPLYSLSSSSLSTPVSSCPSSPSAVCPTSPVYSPSSFGVVPTQYTISCNMFVPCSNHGPLTPEEEQIIMQKRRYRQDKLERYRLKRLTRNFNKRVNENRSRVAQKRARDEHGHFVSTKKNQQQQLLQSQMQARLQEPRVQMVPDMFATQYQWDPSTCVAEMPVF